MKSSDEGILESEKRGKHKNRPNRVSEAIRSSVKEHIESYPVVESHYCRKSTKKTFLDVGTSLTGMYEKYKGARTEKNEDFSSEHFYKKTFNYSFNIDFHKPKKDLCDECEAFKSLSEENKEGFAEDHAKHLENKKIVRALMEKDKE